MALVTAAVVSAVAAVGSAYMTYRQGKAQQKAIRAQQRQADLANARERRNAVRNARIQRASIESQASLTGMTGSSAAAGSISNVQSRLGENLSFLDQMIGLSQQASRANEEAASWASRAGITRAIGGVVSGGLMRFGGPTPTPAGTPAASAGGKG